MKTSRHAERGKGNIKLIIWLLIFGAVGLVLFKIVPPYINDYQLHDTVQSESRYFAGRQKTAEAVRSSVWSELQSLRIPAERENIIVSEAGRTAHVEVKYTVVVELPGYTLNLNFDNVAESPIL
jgi:hypothetical protein